jgi:glucose uptake protein GlcU
MNCSPTDLGCIPNDPVGFVAKFYGIGLGIIGGLAVLFIIYGGYIILSSQGNPQNLNKGKSYIMYAIIGLLLAIFGYVFVQIIAVDVLKIPGFS